MEYTHADFWFSAQKAIDDHFTSFNYPARISFSEKELEHINQVGASILLCLMLIPMQEFSKPTLSLN